MALTTSSVAVANLGKPVKIQGYNFYGCQSKYKGHKLDLCSQKVTQSVLSEAKNM